MVAGTSTGGVITGLITTPASQDVPTRPLFTAKEVFNFYDRHATTLLPQTSTFFKLGGGGWCCRCDCRTPSSRANDLDRLLNRTFGTFPHLSSTITSVLIPSFDIRIQEPILFSSWQANRDPIDNAPVELVCQATSASPTYFPPVEFTLTATRKEPHRAKPFSLIDGSLAINNPTGVAITQAIKEVQTDSAKGRVKYKSFSDLLVLSLGTGQHPKGHAAREATRWSLIGCPKAPRVDSVLNVTADMVDLNISLLFQSEKAGANYPPNPGNPSSSFCFTDRLTGSFASIDTCGHEHLSQVTDLGMQLLDEPVMQRDFKTGKLVPVADGVINREALYRFARWLSEERKAPVAPPPPKPNKPLEPPPPPAKVPTPAACPDPPKVPTAGPCPKACPDPPKVPTPGPCPKACPDPPKVPTAGPCPKPCPDPPRCCCPHPCPSHCFYPFPWYWPPPPPPPPPPPSSSLSLPLPSLSLPHSSFPSLLSLP
ncbi:unnamed protein product [Sphagnum troendelagicum]|uniref:Patatin n=1 Tax=Sphagnum troendelagicum TaxID=128251 RepID=A0ABP0TJ60_9BRYO